MSPRKRPLVEIVVPAIVSNLGGEGKDLIERGLAFGNALAGLLDTAKRPGGVRAVIDIGADGPRARILMGEEQDGNDNARIHDPARPPTVEHPKRRPPGRRVAKPDVE